MKKLLSLILVLSVILSVSVSAKAPNLDIITSTKNFTCTTETRLKLDKPLKILDFLENLGAFESVENYVDFRLLAESLFESGATAVIKSDISDDFKKIKYSMELDSTEKASINKNLNVAVNSKMAVWIDIDFSSSEPKFDLIITHPMMAKYLYITYDDLFGGNAEAQTIIDLMYGSGIIEQLYNSSASLLTRHADIKFKGNKCTVKLSDEAFDRYLADCFTLVSGFVPDIDADFIDELKDFLAKTKFIADSGITYEIALSGKSLKSVTVTVPVEISIYDTLINFGVETDSLMGLTPEDGLIAFTSTQVSTYKNIGKTKDISMPVLTEENSISFAELFPRYEPESDYDHEDEAVTFDYWIYANADRSVIADGAYYVPFRALVDNACSFNPECYNIAYNNGVISFSSPLADFSSLEFIVGNSDYWCDGQKYTFAPPVEIDGTVWVDVKMFETLFNWSLSSYSWNYLENSLFIEMYNNFYQF